MRRLTFPAVKPGLETVKVQTLRDDEMDNRHKNPQRLRRCGSV